MPHHISFVSGSWIGNGDEGVYLMPGESQTWLMWGFKYEDTVSVAAHPFGFVTDELYLAVENINFEGGRNGLRLHFTVKNIGTVPIFGYGVSVSWISR